MKKILLLGSGELGKEFTIAAQRLGQHVIACDAYAGAPAMQVADVQLKSTTPTSSYPKLKQYAPSASTILKRRAYK